MVNIIVNQKRLTIVAATWIIIFLVIVFNIIVGGIACDNQKCDSLEDQGHKAPCMHCHEDQSEIQSGII